MRFGFFFSAVHRNLLMVSYDRFSDLTGTDYSEGAIDLAKKIATRDGFTNINFLVRIIFKQL